MTTNKQLRELAEKATPGKWDLSVHTNPVGSFDAKRDDWTISVGGTRIVAMEDGFRNASDVRFIAAASPATILAQLDENEALQAENALLRAAIRRLCDIYVVDDYYEGQLREESLDAAVNRAINATPQPAPDEYLMGKYPASRHVQDTCTAAPAPPIPEGWKPIDTAPKDNKRPLMIARFNDDEELMEFDYDASWESDRESWEIPEVYYFWASAKGAVVEPTHWMYQPDWFTAAPQPATEQRPDVTQLVDALAACAKASSAAEVGLIVDAALAAHRKRGDV